MNFGMNNDQCAEKGILSFDKVRISWFGMPKSKVLKLYVHDTLKLIPENSVVKNVICINFNDVYYAINFREFSTFIQR